MGATVSRTVEIAAPAHVIFDILADPRQHVLIDGSNTVRTHVKGPRRLRLGSSFSTLVTAPVRRRHRLATVRYRVHSQVVEFEADRRIAWRPTLRQTWRYVLEPGETTTRVTETFDVTFALGSQLLRLTGMTRSTVKTIEATLRRLKDVAESRVDPPE